jgi:phosphoribosylanthranilate isomerase
LAEQAGGKARIVALTVDAEDAVLEEIVREIAPDFLQLHGRETPERVAEIKARFGRPVIKAVLVRTPEDVGTARAYAQVADLILFDAKSPAGATRPGGHGQAFEWAILNGVANEMPFMLSGGLDADNVAAAIGITGASAVDVSSGVERSPGVKDVGLINRFLQSVKAANQSARK